MKRSVLFALIVFICFSQVSADSTAGKTSIEINLPSRTLSLYGDGLLLKEYPVCVGKQSTPTPEGEYRVIYKTINPYWINKDNVVPPGPQNPLGVRWIGITRTIGIHGNNKPDSIGTYASAGCIRMYNRDVEEVYTLVPLNTPVTIKYDRIKIFNDKYTGIETAVLYPDGYKRDATGSKSVMEQMEQMELPEDLMKKARKVLEKPFSKPVAISKGIGVFMNNSLITCDVLEEQGEVYMNCKAAEDVLGLTSETAGLFDIGVKELEGRIYINLTQTVKKFGGTMNYDKTSGNAYINMKILKVNGVFAGINYGDYDKTDFMAVEDVKKLGYEYSEDSVDLRLFDKGLMKLERKKVWSVNADNITIAMGGHKNVSSQYGVVDLKLPTYIRFNGQYYITENVDGRLALGRASAYSIREKTDWAAEASLLQGENAAEAIDLEMFLEGYDYTSNIFGTLVDIREKEL